METKKIAVLEHHKDIESLILTILEDEGYVAQPISRVGDPIEAIRHWGPDLIILDIRSLNPEADLHLLHQLGDNVGTSHVPILVLSSITEAGRAALAAHNVNSSLGKPFSLEDFCTKTRQALIN